MLLNLSNHPADGWTDVQRRAAEEAFGDVLDLPFPAIDPAWDAVEVDVLAAEYAERCCAMLAQREGGLHAVHVMGEMTFTVALVRRLQASGVRCVAATTERLVVPDGSDERRVTFRFVRFRTYPAPLSP